MTFVGLIRGINVGGNRRLPMAELRAACAARGLRDVRTYIQSGNVVFGSDEPEAVAAATLADAIRAVGGFDVPVAVRDAAAFSAIVAACPFPDAAERPKSVHLALAAAPISAAAAADLEAWPGPERVRVVNGAVYADYVDGVGTSKLTPAWLDRRAAAPVTARNWATVGAILGMIGV